MGDEIGEINIQETHVKAALEIQPGWKVSLAEGEFGQEIRFQRWTAEYEIVNEVQWGGVIGTASFNPWHVRDAFLALKSTQDALTFFAKYGPFMFAEGWEDRGYPSDCELYELEMGAPLAWPVDWLAGSQAFYSEALTHPPAAWLPPTGKRLGISEQFKDWNRLQAFGRVPEFIPHPGNPLYFSMTAYCVRDALAASLCLDQYAQRTHRRCKHCGKVFALGSKHQRDYCDIACGNLHRVARKRARERAVKEAGSSTL